MGILDVKETIRACRYCFMCRYSCPTFKAIKREAVTPRGYALMMMAIENGKQDWTDDIASAFYQCTLCGLGRERCEFKWAEDDMVRNARAEMVSTDHAPNDVKSAAETFLKNGKTGELSPALPGEKPDAEVLFFAGCQTRANNPEIAHATEQVLNKLGVKWTMLEEESCCGGGLYDLGYFQEAKQKAHDLSEKISNLKPAKIVTGCAHCYRTIKEFYPTWESGLSSKIQILHISEYLDQKVQDGSLKLNGRTVSSSIGYHDPCMLGRKMSVYDAPRSLIQEITGQPPIELFHNKELAECCGAGSATFLFEPEAARKVGQLRLDRAKEAGITTLVTACQNCKTVLKEAAKGEDVQVVDLTELVARNLE